VKVVSEAEDSDTVRGFDMDSCVLERCGGGGGGDDVSPFRLAGAASTDCARFAAALAAPDGPNEAACQDKMEGGSSMGVKIL
jgi:hypothetical protein